MRQTSIKWISIFVAVALIFISCGDERPQRTYNEGINIIPRPNMVMVTSTDHFQITSNTTFGVNCDSARSIAEFFSHKIAPSTGYSLSVVDRGADITLTIDEDLETKAEGYILSVKPTNITITAKDNAGLYYGMQTLLQLLPAEITASTKVRNIDWLIPTVEIEDAPRFGYRGVMLDVCRHFLPVEFIKKQLDILSMFKINRMHWHLTEDQAWRVEIKRYPKLVEIGSKRIEGDGEEYSGYYTQDDVREIVAYAAERNITIIPEFELPGHELAAIAAYPELSCEGKPTTPRIIWGVEDVVMCPAKEETFEFIEGVIEELTTLFPGEYFHVGGDECPKRSWAACERCQQFIKDNNLQAKDGHSAEERLQSYVIGGAEEMLNARGKRLIGWDEILEGGLSPTATVMSWRGEKGGIAAALQGREVIMTPESAGLYLNYYQGDNMIEPITIGGNVPLSKTYSYNPTPAQLVEEGCDDLILGVQGNLWSEYMYSSDMVEYQAYPRALAVAELAWSRDEDKDLDDFYRRVNNAYVRLDGYGVNYHIPQPEQPSGSINRIVFTDGVEVEFTTTRPIDMVYTLDGSDPTSKSPKYIEPLYFDKDATLKICSILPSGKMSPVREISIEKQSYSPAVSVTAPKQGLKMNRIAGDYYNMAELSKSTQTAVEKIISSVSEVVEPQSRHSSCRNIDQAANIAEGYLLIESDGVYQFRTNNNEFWIDGKLLIDNDNDVKRYSRRSNTVALSAGLHPIKVVWLGNIIGGWPSNWDSGAVEIRKYGEPKGTNISPEQIFY